MGECCSKNDQNQKHEIISSNILNHSDVKKMNKKEVIMNYEQKIKELEYTIHDLQDRVATTGGQNDKQSLTKQIEILDRRNKDLLLELNNIRIDMRVTSTSNMETNQYEENENSLFHKLGGQEMIEQVVTHFYESVLKSKTLAKYFKPINIIHQKTQLTNFMVEQLGGPKQYKGKDMITAHKQFDITHKDFDRMSEIFTKTLQSLSLGSTEINEMQLFFEKQRILIVNLSKSSNLKLDSSVSTPQKVQKPKKYEKKNNQNIFKEIGGEQAIVKAVDIFYEKVQLESMVSHYFKNIDMSDQKKKMRQFLTLALGGPNEYKGKDMKSAHKHLNIQYKEFAKIVQLLMETLEELDVSDSIAEDIAMLLAPLQHDIVVDIEQQKSIYKRLGGRDSIVILINKFYNNLKEEPDIFRFFKNKDMATQESQMVNFLSSRFGGEIQYSGPSLREAHSAVFIQSEDFDLFVKIFTKTLTQLKIDQITIQQILEIFADVKHVISMQKQSLYNRIGAAKKMDSIVDAFYKKILNDISVSRLFNVTNMKQQKIMFKSFFQEALGGEKNYKGKDMKTAHQRLKISEDNFNSVARHMSDSLAEFDIEKKEVAEIMELLETLRSSIVYDPTKFGQAGGEEGIAKIVEIFYNRILIDDTLKPYFKSVNMPQLKKHQAAFLTMVLGGPNNYKGRDMRESHKILKISDENFDKTVQHLNVALKQVKVNDTLRKQIIDLVAPLRDDIVYTEEDKKKEQEKEEQEKNKVNPHLDKNIPLIKRIGGNPAVGSMMDMFYDRILDNKIISKYFLNIDMPKQRSHIKVFLIQAFGGDKNYIRRDMKVAHQNIQITEKVFNEFISLLVKSMQDIKIPQVLIDEALEIYQSFKPEIVNHIPIVEQLGGHDKLADLITRFFDSVLKDEQLKKFFKKEDEEKKQFILQHMINYLDQQLGGSSKYQGRDMKSIHQNLQISKSDFDQFCKILIKHMKDDGLNTNIIKGVGKTIDAARKNIQAASVAKQ